MRVLSVIAILIAYGSLYPGNFSVPNDGVLAKFFTDWRMFTSRGDLLGNLALFFPLGVAGMLFSSQGLNTASRIVWLLFLAFVLSFTLQLAQVWLPSRSPALADVIWNMAGMVLGMAAAHVAGQRAAERIQASGSASIVAQSVLILWLLTELLPLVPSLDWQKFKDALKPLFLGYTLSTAPIMHAVGVIVAGSAFLELARRPAWWLLSALVLVITGKLVIVDLTLDTSFLMGLLIGYMGFLAVLRLDRTKIFVLAFWLLFAAWSITAITPFSPASGGTFNGIPFATMLRGSMETAVRGLVQSLFIYTGLVWLVGKTGIDIKKAMVGLTVWSCLIEVMQMALLGRTADVTEPFLLLLVGWLVSATRSFERSASHEIGNSTPAPQSGTYAGMSGRYALGLIAVGIAVCVAAGWLITQSPLTPYNVRELVYEGHPLRSLALLAALLYWVIGFPILMAQWLGRGELYLLSFPALAVLHGLIAWMLLWSSVPSESIHDIVGSPVLHWPGEWELIGRFLALFSIWSVAATAGCLVAARRILPTAGSALLGWAMGACLLVPVSYYVVVIAAATDNLVELIASNGSVPAFLLIGTAIAVSAFAGTKGALALIPGTAWRTGAIGWVLASGVLAYLALYLGTEQVIVKYGQVFSALQFLLSSDRSHLVEPVELMVRYAALYGCLITAIVTVQYPLWRWIMSASPKSDGHIGEDKPSSIAKY